MENNSLADRRVFLKRSTCSALVTTVPSVFTVLQMTPTVAYAQAANWSWQSGSREILTISETGNYKDVLVADPNDTFTIARKVYRTIAGENNSQIILYGIYDYFPIAVGVINRSSGYIAVRPPRSPGQGRPDFPIMSVEKSDWDTIPQCGQFHRKLVGSNVVSKPQLQAVFLDSFFTNRSNIKDFQIDTSHDVHSLSDVFKFSYRIDTQVTDKYGTTYSPGNYISFGYLTGDSDALKVTVPERPRFNFRLARANSAYELYSAKSSNFYFKGAFDKKLERVIEAASRAGARAIGHALRNMQRPRRQEGILDMTYRTSLLTVNTVGYVLTNAAYGPVNTWAVNKLSDWYFGSAQGVANSYYNFRWIVDEGHFQHRLIENNIFDRYCEQWDEL